MNNYKYLVKNQWTLIEIFGYKPPSRLDFAYCKASFKNKVKKSTNEDKELNELDKRINYENTCSLEPAFIDRTDNGRFYNKYYFWTSKYKKKFFFFKFD